MPLLHDLFRTQALAHPDLPAVSDGQHTLTYRELDSLTDRLAAELQAQGACVDSCVVIYMSKSINYVVSYIAILKSGAAYLPMDGKLCFPLIPSLLRILH
jgi:tyrocidine synthetase-3